MPTLTRPGLDEMMARLEGTLAASPADATEIVWIDARRGQESNGKRRRDSYEHAETTVFVRVRESGRYGFHRTEVAEPADLARAVREALAQARLSDPVPAALRPEGATAPVHIPGEIHDPEIARMTPARARDLIQRLTTEDETVRLGWAEGRVAVADNRGLRRAAEATTAWAGILNGTGRAAAASRSLSGLGLSSLLARAKEREGPETAEATLPDGPVPVVLSQESAAALLDLLNRRALTSTSFLHGTSCLRDSLGAPVFHPAVTLRDDGTDPRGLPFPFDLLGSARRPIDLIAGGVLQTPAVDDRLARQLDRPPTPHLVAPDEAAASHLFLVPGATADEQLLGDRDGGLWIAALDPLESFNPYDLRFRAIARGVRRIEGGRLGAALPDLVWEDDLRTLLSGALEVGAEPVTLGENLFGGITAPILALERVSGFRL
ncbi:MAG TPA: metallopeptidase TldD-related protein [Thermoanaerobaculia bacterium]|jgi:PmbA protein|nr:metallopeptidase TldD-related protein [Thermoanaerobaculia bacterium]